jgi:hypothetical protein
MANCVVKHFLRRPQIELKYICNSYKNRNNFFLYPAALLLAPENSLFMFFIGKIITRMDLSNNTYDMPGILLWWMLVCSLVLTPLSFRLERFRYVISGIDRERRTVSSENLGESEATFIDFCSFYLLFSWPEIKLLDLFTVQRHKFYVKFSLHLSRFRSRKRHSGISLVRWKERLRPPTPT